MFGGQDQSSSEDSPRRAWQLSPSLHHRAAGSREHIYQRLLYNVKFPTYIMYRAEMKSFNQDLWQFPLSAEPVVKNVLPSGPPSMARS